MTECKVKPKLTTRIGKAIANIGFWGILPLLIMHTWIAKDWTRKLFMSDIIVFFFGIILYGLSRETTDITN